MSGKGYSAAKSPVGFDGYDIRGGTRSGEPPLPPPEQPPVTIQVQLPVVGRPRERTVYLADTDHHEGLEDVDNGATEVPEGDGKFGAEMNAMDIAVHIGVPPETALAVLVDMGGQQGRGSESFRGHPLGYRGSFSQEGEAWRKPSAWLNDRTAAALAHYSD